MTRQIPLNTYAGRPYWIEGNLLEGPGLNVKEPTSSAALACKNMHTGESTEMAIPSPAFALSPTRCGQHRKREGHRSLRRPVEAQRVIAPGIHGMHLGMCGIHVYPNL
jgi:hypothetical protein